MAAHELDPRMPAVDGFTIVLGRLSEAIDGNWERAVDAEDPEGLHDLRVAVRRTRAVLRTGRKVLPAAMVVESRRLLRALTAASGPARDLDVLVGSWPSLRAALEAERAMARAELVAVLRDPATVAWRRRWPDSVADAPSAAEPGPHAHRQLGRVLARRLDRSQRAVLAAGRALRPSTTDAALHQLRKDARLLRHLLECFAELAPHQEARFVKRLKALQDVLGRHQDLVVQVELLAGLGTGFDVDELRRERDATRAEFSRRFAKYDTPRARHSFDELVDRVQGRGA